MDEWIDELVLLLGCIVLGISLLLSIRKGQTELGSRVIKRSERPVLYWTFLLLGFALFVVFFYFAFALGG